MGNLKGTIPSAVIWVNDIKKEPDLYDLGFRFQMERNRNTWVILNIKNKRVFSAIPGVPYDEALFFFDIIEDQINNPNTIHGYCLVKKNKLIVWNKKRIHSGKLKTFPTETEDYLVLTDMEGKSQLFDNLKPISKLYGAMDRLNDNSFNVKHKGKHGLLDYKGNEIMAFKKKEYNRFDNTLGKIVHAKKKYRIKDKIFKVGIKGGQKIPIRTNIMPLTKDTYVLKEGKEDWKLIKNDLEVLSSKISLYFSACGYSSYGDSALESKICDISGDYQGDLLTYYHTNIIFENNSQVKTTDYNLHPDLEIKFDNVTFFQVWFKNNLIGENYIDVELLKSTYWFVGHNKNGTSDLISPMGVKVATGDVVEVAGWFYSVMHVSESQPLFGVVNGSDVTFYNNLGNIVEFYDKEDNVIPCSYSLKDCDSVFIYKSIEASGDTDCILVNNDLDFQGMVDNNNNVLVPCMFQSVRNCNNSPYKEVEYFPNFSNNTNNFLNVRKNKKVSRYNNNLRNLFDTKTQTLILPEGQQSITRVKGNDKNHDLIITRHSWRFNLFSRKLNKYILNDLHDIEKYYFENGSTYFVVNREDSSKVELIDEEGNTIIEEKGASFVMVDENYLISSVTVSRNIRYESLYDIHTKKVIFQEKQQIELTSFFGSDVQNCFERDGGIKCLLKVTDKNTLSYSLYDKNLNKVK